jgi:uncharacterized protein YecT (DUF1311 family)
MECPNRETNGVGGGMGRDMYVINCALKECPKDKPLRAQNGSCYSCDAPNFEPGDGYKIANCSSCSNRTTDGKCMLKKSCPSSHPLFVDGQGCYACDDSNDSASYTNNCDVCKNREIKKPKYGNRQLCEIKEAVANVQAQDGRCPDDKPLKQWDDTCYSCDVDKEVRIDSKCNWEPGTCERICPNREIVYQPGGNPASVLKCPADKPLRDESGRCYSCDYEWDIGWRWQIPEKCEQVCQNRFHYDNWCVLKTSPERKPAFDCGDVTKLKKFEREICMNKYLSARDMEMSELYNQVLEKYKDDSARLDQIKTEQKKWLKSRGHTYLQFTYQKRIKELKEMLE